MEFEPAAYVRGDRIGLIQFLRARKIVGKTVSPYNTGNQQPHRPVVGNWYVDFGGTPAPFFGIDLTLTQRKLVDSSTGRTGKKASDGSWSHAFMCDEPSRTWTSNQIVEHRFVTAAVSFKHQLGRVRDVLPCFLCGLLTWGYRVAANGNLSLLNLGTVDRLPKFIDPVLSAWSNADRALGRIRARGGHGTRAFRLKVVLRQFGWT